MEHMGAAAPDATPRASRSPLRLCALLSGLFYLAAVGAGFWRRRPLAR
jgi:hypothetical protein